MMMFAEDAFSNLVALFCKTWGRPKQIWASEVYSMAVEIAEGFDIFGARDGLVFMACENGS